MQDERPAMPDSTAAVMVTGRDGNILSQNKVARKLLGPGTGKPCWDVMRRLGDGETLPCRTGCAQELLGAGIDYTRHARFRLNGIRHSLSCIPVNGVVVCSLSPTSSRLPNGRPFLSSREREILLLLANGETTASAAQRLGVCESTVRTHVERMRCKLRVSTRAAVVAEGFRLGHLD